MVYVLIIDDLTEHVIQKNSQIRVFCIVYTETIMVLFSKTCSLNVLSHTHTHTHTPALTHLTTDKREWPFVTLLFFSLVPNICLSFFKTERLRKPWRLSAFLCKCFRFLHLKGAGQPTDSWQQAHIPLLLRTNLFF